MTDTIDKRNLPTSFGAFKPVGNLMVGLPNLAAARALTTSLRQAGWQDGVLVQQPPSARAHRLHPARRGGGKLPPATRQSGYRGGSLT
jgi:hypothetical protein